MKIKELNGIAYSTHSDILSTIIWDKETGKDVIDGCSIEYAIENYGEKEIKRISVYQNSIVITI